MEKAVIISIIGLVAALSGITYKIGSGNTATLSAELTKYQAWEQWKSSYGKQYQFEEIPLRYSVFSTNYDFIQQHNSENHKYTVGLNAYADLTAEEFASYRMRTSFPSKLQNTVTLTPPKAIPNSLNWNTKGAVGPVNNQGQCGSCWAFSATEAIEGLYEVSTGKYDQFSVQQIVDCSEYTGAEGCNGGWPQWAYEYVQQYGIELASSYPYTGETDTCQYDASKVVFKIGGYVNVTQNSPSSMLAAIQKQPLSVCIEADSSSFQFYSSGIYDDSGCGTNLDHCVLLDGYNQGGSTPYWIVQNSWGTSWGQNGYIWIEYGNGDGICGINTWVTYPTK